MTTFSVYALPPAALARIRKTGRDDFGHPLRISDDHAGDPLRCCLRDAEPGERVALFSWQPLTDAPDSPYAEIGPVFAHADACPGYTESTAYPQASGTAHNCCAPTQPTATCSTTRSPRAPTRKQRSTSSCRIPGQR